MRPARFGVSPVVKILRRIAPCVVSLFATAIFGGCASMPDADEYLAYPVLLDPPNGGATARDDRARFREIFCQVAQRENFAGADPNCEQFLWRLPDEAELEKTSTELPNLDTSLHIVVVGGAFSDCFGAASVAYGAAIKQLESKGVTTTVVPISGRSSAEFNARIIAESLHSASIDPEQRIVLLGYSKGTVDILHFLNGYPDLAPQVQAVISVSGAIFGSAVADQGAWAYDTLLKNTFKKRCDPGDHGVVDSMKTEVRRAWLEQHEMPGHIRFYTIAAFTTRDHLARGLRSSWRILARTNRRNDGQVTISDALFPGSTLLGYANADHWGVAIDIEQELDFIAGRPDDHPFPRSVLFEAYLRYVSEDLGE